MHQKMHGFANLKRSSLAQFFNYIHTRWMHREKWKLFSRVPSLFFFKTSSSEINSGWKPKGLHPECLPELAGFATVFGSCKPDRSEWMRWTSHAVDAALHTYVCKVSRFQTALSGSSQRLCILSRCGHTGPPRHCNTNKEENKQIFRAEEREIEKNIEFTSFVLALWLKPLWLRLQALDHFLC